MRGFFSILICDCTASYLTASLDVSQHQNRRKKIHPVGISSQQFYDVALLGFAAGDLS